jgi:hypothetical protein
LAASRVVVDKDLLGWADENAEELSKQWSEIRKVGLHPDLPQRTQDATIATYCKDNDCDFLTADKNAYTYYFEAKIKTVQITRYDWYKTGDKPVYLIEIIS